MLGPYRYPFIPRHTHMSEGEVAIWRRFVEKFPTRFSVVYFDWEVGGVRPTLAELADYVEQNRQYLGRYKIDVVAEDDKMFHIFEIKREATTKALGEIWLYQELFIAEEKPKKPVHAMILTDVEMPNIREVAERDGAELIVV